MIEDIISILRRHRFIIDNEKHLQEQIYDQLCAQALPSMLPIIREVHLSAGDIIDFTIAGSIGIEVKLRCPKRKIYHQVVRYCNSGQLTDIIIYSATTVGMPQSINNVNIWVLNPSHSWL